VIFFIHLKTKNLAIIVARNNFGAPQHAPEMSKDWRRIDFLPKLHPSPPAWILDSPRNERRAKNPPLHEPPAAPLRDEQRPPLMTIESASDESEVTPRTDTSKEDKIEGLPVMRLESPAPPPRLCVLHAARANLGEGTYGSVKRGTVEFTNGVSFPCAIKKFRPLKSHGGQTEEHIEPALRESQPLLIIPPHPNVVELYALVLREKGIQMITPLYPCDMARLVRTRFSAGAPYAAIRDWTRQLLRGLEHIHAHGYVHRDLKMENILVTSEGTLRISDLGMARDTVSMNPSLHCTTGDVCTLWTRAPEIAVTRGRYDTSMDIWSLGATILAACAGEYVIRSSSLADDFLFQCWRLLGKPRDEDWPELASKGGQGSGTRDIWTAIPHTCFDFYGNTNFIAMKLQERVGRHDLPRDLFILLARMLEIVPSRRISATEALKHSFFMIDDGGIPWRPPFDMWECSTSASRHFQMNNGIHAPIGGESILYERWKPEVGVVPKTKSPQDQQKMVSLSLFLTQRPRMTAKMRTIVVGWMWELHHHFRFNPCCFFDAVQLMDRFIVQSKLVGPNNLQLYGLACFSLVCKLMEVRPPSPQKWLDMTEGCFKRSSLTAAEFDVLKCVGGSVLLPLQDRLSHYLKTVLSNSLALGLAAAIVICPLLMSVCSSAPALVREMVDVLLIALHAKPSRTFDTINNFPRVRQQIHEFLMYVRSHPDSSELSLAFTLGMKRDRNITSLPSFSILTHS
jgi:cyclin-dependent kinase 8/11